MKFLNRSYSPVSFLAEGVGESATFYLSLNREKGRGLCAKSQICEFTLSDLFDLFFPPDRGIKGYVCMVFQSFLDDSGHKTAGLMVSAGFCAQRKTWADFRTGWKGLLLKHKLDYFKSSECNHIDGQFRQFCTGKYAQKNDKEKAKSIRKEFLDLAAGYKGIAGFGVVVEMEPYARLAHLPNALDILPEDPYREALSSLMFEIVNRVRSRDRNCMVAFVHDDDQDCFRELHDCYCSFRKVNPKAAKHMGGFAGMDDKTTPELQFADLLANHTAYVGSKSPSARQGFLEMKENIAYLGLWDEAFLTRLLKSTLRKRRQPLPFEIGGMS
jgi:hypothetical protein